jgi:putative ABC transport system substrate-binding protein
LRSKNRRKFLTLSAAAGLFPVAARAQGSRRTIGVLMAGSEGSAENVPRIAAFRKALTELGWRDGDNVEITTRWSAGKNELVQQYAKELVERAPDVILANSTTVISALKGRTESIPVVFALAMDPVGLGQIKSLSHPGGNFTGFTFIDPELIGKWMELLGDVVPGLTQAGILFNPDTMNPYPNFVREVQETQKSKISPRLVPVRTNEEVTSAMESFAASPGGGVMIGPDPFNQVHLKQMAELAIKLRLPSISVYRSYVTAGGLMGYGPDVADVFR